MSEDNAARDQRLYKYPDSDILRNKLELTNAAALDRAERLLVQRRTRQGAPSGNFDLNHLKAIHRHLFQDMYAWAGDIRQVDMHKTDWFLPHGRIITGMQDVHQRLAAQNLLAGLDRDDFAEAAGVILGDVNFCHPFREGNGRRTCSI